MVFLNTMFLGLFGINAVVAINAVTNGADAQAWRGALPAAISLVLLIACRRYAVRNRRNITSSHAGK